MTAAMPGQAASVPRESLEALIQAWSAKADEPDRDPYAAAAYRIAKGNLIDVLAAASEQPCTERDRLRAGIESLAAQLGESAALTHPSRKSQIELTVAEMLRELLEGGVS